LRKLSQMLDALPGEESTDLVIQETDLAVETEQAPRKRRPRASAQDEGRSEAEGGSGPDTEPKTELQIPQTGLRRRAGQTLASEPKKPPAKRRGLLTGWKRRRRGRKIVVVKESALGMLLKPIGISLALLLIAYGMMSIGVTFWRSYQSQLLHSASVHADRSILDILFPDQSIPPDAVQLVVKDVNGKVHRLVASKSATDKFVNQTLLMLDSQRDQIKQQANQDIDRSFALAFRDRDQSISNYADWFFAWKRSYVVLKETIASAITRAFEAGKYQNLDEAIDADVQDYFLKNYKEQVLKPDLRDPTIAQGVDEAVRHAHDSYVRVIANGDLRLQLFLAQNTKELNALPPSQAATHLKLDWDAQKWKAPTYLMEDKAFSGVVGMGTIAAGGTFGALALGPALDRVIAQSFSQMSARFVTSLGARVALAEEGAVAGTMVQPLGGQVIGAALGILVGTAIDYLGNEANEAFNRDKFIKANNEALDATIQTWKTRIKANVDAAIDKWFDDARASVVLSSS
jgi:hypothetical protein